MPNYDLALRLTALRAKQAQALAALGRCASLTDPLVAEAYQVLTTDFDPEDARGPARQAGDFGADGRVSAALGVATMVIPPGLSMGEHRKARRIKPRPRRRRRPANSAELRLLRAEVRELRTQLNALDDDLVGAAPFAVVPRALAQMARTAPQRAEVVRLAAAGLSNGQIADQTASTMNTVKTHLRIAFADLGVTRRAQLAGQLNGNGDSP